MINIFNLFLTLFFFWLLFAYSNDSLSWFYIFFGLFSAAIVSFISWKIKIINKYSHFLFLNIGFYKHFIGIIISDFFASLKIIFHIVFNSKIIDPKIYSLPIKKINSTELVLLISTINFSAGMIFVGIKDEKILIWAINQSFIKRLNLDKIYDDLHKINDNRLV